MKKIILLVIIIIVFLILFFFQNKNDLGKKAISFVKNEIENKNIVINDYRFFKLAEFSEKNEFSSCIGESGVLVTKEVNGYFYEDFIKCENYVSKINDDGKSIEGPELIIINKDKEYNEISSVKIVSTRELGDLKIVYYQMNNKSEKRVIIYANNKNINVNGEYNDNYPTINLNGSDIAINKGDIYKEPGFTAIDSHDGDITKDVRVVGEINNNINGEYYLHYIVVNSRDNYYSVTRKVTVKNNKDFALTGSCNAKVRSDSVNIEVNTNAENRILEYEYTINDLKFKNYLNPFVYNDTYTKDNLPNVSVKITDDDFNVANIKCTVQENFVLKVVTDVNGYDCLEGFVCYKQRDYNTIYQATSDGPGPLSRTGCLPVSMAIIAAGFGLRSSDGNLYTPPTLVNEIIYPDGKIWGVSEYPRVVYIAEKLNLKVSEKYHQKDVDILKSELRKGNLIILTVNGGCYSTGSHYLTVIGINDNDEIFVADPWSKTNKSMTGECTVNNWTTINEFIKKGQPNYFAVISK